jgi:hypothetical protein
VRLKGQVDLLNLTEVAAEIVDFKSGGEDDHHAEQVILYGLLWLTDQVANPDRTPVGALRVSYPANVVEVPPPTDWQAVQEEDAARIEAADVSLTEAPMARVSEDCRYCSVRHMCEEYWLAGSSAPVSDSFGDAEVHVEMRHGPLSWRARLVAGGGAALVRSSSEDVPLDAGMTVRLLDVRVDRQLTEDGDDDVVVLTLLSTSEIFEVS